MFILLFNVAHNDQKFITTLFEITDLLENLFEQRYFFYE